MENKRLICPVCGAVFSSNAAFYSHINEHAKKDKENECIAKNVESDFQLIKAKFDEFLTILRNFNEAYSEFGYDAWIDLGDELVLSTPDETVRGVISTPDKTTCGNCKTEPSSFEQFLEDFVNDTISKKQTKPCAPDYKEILHNISDSFDKEEDVTEADLINKIREQSENFSSIDESQFINGLAEAAVEELFEMLSKGEI
jgi:uncharacterized C2H2 Zn-finger protein